jgi:hypothetical protein
LFRFQDHLLARRRAARRRGLPIFPKLLDFFFRGLSYFEFLGRKCWFPRFSTLFKTVKRSGTSIRALLLVTYIIFRIPVSYNLDKSSGKVLNERASGTSSGPKWR